MMRAARGIEKLNYQKEIRMSLQRGSDDEKLHNVISAPAHYQQCYDCKGGNVGLSGLMITEQSLILIA